MVGGFSLYLFFFSPNKSGCVMSYETSMIIWIINYANSTVEKSFITKMVKMSQIICRLSKKQYKSCYLFICLCSCVAVFVKNRILIKYMLQV